MEWLLWMKAHEGESEYTGTIPSAFVEECFSHTNYGPLHGSTPPSCAATLCAALEESGYKSTKSAAAVSYTHYGDSSPTCRGAIVVFQWGNGDHHVSVVDKVNADGTITCIGGNQGHKLQSSTFGSRWIIASRWPVK